jgi:hypothetical protein
MTQTEMPARLQPGRGILKINRTQIMTRTKRSKSQADLLFEAMVAAGYLVPTGGMRPDRQGVLQPVYVSREWAVKMGLPLPPLLPLLPFPEDQQKAN